MSALASLFPDSVVTVEATSAMWEAALHPQEAVCVVRAVAKRRREFAAGRACARRALAHLGIRDFPLVPDSDRVPIWPPGIAGSITHTAGLCAVAAARVEVARSLGLDAEAAEPLEAKLVARICTPREAERLARLPRRPGLDWPKLAFSAKEAVYKCYFPVTRRILEFHDLELEIDAESGSFAARLVRGDAPAAHGVRVLHGRFAHTPEHVLAGVTLPASPTAAPSPVTGS